MASPFSYQTHFNTGLNTIWSDSDCDDVLCLRTFLTLGNSELNLLTFGQGLETRALNSAEVSKYVWTVFLLDETKAFGFVEPFNGTGSSRHNKIL